LNQKINQYICLLLFLFSNSIFFAQKINLEIISKTEIENTVFQKIKFDKKHTDSTSIHLEIVKISNYLKKMGYFTHTIDSIKRTEKVQSIYITLNSKIDKAIINLNTNDHFIFPNYKKENNAITIPIDQLQNLLSEASLQLDKEGKSFSKVTLTNIYISKDNLFANLEIEASEKRIINKVVIKGYENFPKSLLKNYFKIKPKTIFNQKKIKEISDASKELTFIGEIKPPEILFTKDSTLLYLYLQKKQNNSFDGLINFASKENGKLNFNGTIDLKLQNILDSAEKFELFWNRIGDERQELKLLTEIPYIFNSNLTPEITFSIYKQDSTFLNTSFKSKLKYTITKKLKLGISYDSEISSELQKIEIENNIDSFRSTFLGFHLFYQEPKYDTFFNNKFYLEINPFIGLRTSNNQKTNQFKINTIISYIYDLNNRNSIYIKNETGYLNSDNFLNNELFRIGGANSIRGFNEQSIFTSNYTFFNIEYRFLTSNKSYIYSITDIGRIYDNYKNLLSLGLGYNFIKNANQININLVIQQNTTNTILINEAKLTVGWKNTF
tara:strand:- start:11111 stop:12772 length:1662 start_codon:yes stop_codon:yes gene_type:complete